MKKVVLFILTLALVCCIALAMLEFLKDFEAPPVSTSTSEFSIDVPDTASVPESDEQTEESTSTETTSVETTAREETTEVSTLETTEPVTEVVTTEVTGPVDPPEALTNIPEPYRSVLNNLKKFKVTQSGTSVEILLDEYRFPYSFTPITHTNVEYAILDMDGDGKDEVVLTGAYGDMLVLHSVSDVVYGFDFTFRNMYYIKTDGTFSWNGMEQDRLTYGISKLYFEDTDCQLIKLCRVEDDGTDKFLYYIGNQSVTESEYEAFAVTLGQKEIAWFTLDRYPSGAIGG